MQNDYFSKLQRSSSLFMKSDQPDGGNDSYHRGAPLGIKGPARGVSSLADLHNVPQNLINIEDVQHNRLVFNQPYPEKKVSVTWNSSRIPYTDPISYEARGYNVVKAITPQVEGTNIKYKQMGFDDTWKANKIVVKDDMAFVAYDEYTDIHRVELELDDLQFKQYAITKNESVASGSITSSTNRIGSLVGKTYKLAKPDLVHRMHYAEKSKITQDVRDTSDRLTWTPEGVLLTPKEDRHTRSPLPFYDLYNSFLKVDFGTFVGYFVYGGTVRDDFSSNAGPWRDPNDYNPDVASSRSSKIGNDNRLNVGTLSYNNSSSRFQKHGLSTCSTVGTSPGVFDGVTKNTDRPFDSSSTFEDGTVVGMFFLVADGQRNRAVGHPKDLPDSGSVDYENYEGRFNNIDEDGLHIQLSVQSNVEYFQQTDAAYNNGNTWRLYSSALETKSVKIVKYQPVRKCGKIDVYRKKRSFINSIENGVVEGVQNGTHGLSDYDVVNFSNVFFAEPSTGVSDIHPLNGNKYVKVLDPYKFEVYDDKFLTKRAYTDNIRSLDGVQFKSISNNFDSVGSNWDYETSIFSPTGKNGYQYINKANASLSNNVNTISSADYFVSHKRSGYALISSYDIAKNPNQRASSGRDSYLNIDFNKPYDELVNTDWPTELENKIPMFFDRKYDEFWRKGYDSPLEDPQRSYWDFYPYNCQDKKEVAQEGRDPYSGMRFGCDFDVRVVGSDYYLLVGERGPDISVDMWGLEDSLAVSFRYNYRDDLNAAGHTIENTQIFSYLDPDHYSDYVRQGYIGKDDFDHPDLRQIHRSRIVPWHLPQGRTHLIKLNTAGNNQVFSVTHVNTYFGGGDSIRKDFASNVSQSKRVQLNPLYYSNKNYLREFYKNALLSSRNQLQKPTEGLSYTLVGEQYGHDNIGRWAINYIGALGYNERFYWIRSAVAHWVGVDMENPKPTSDNTTHLRQYGFTNFNEGVNFYRTTSVTKSTSDAENKSRFGRVALSLSNYQTGPQKIDRRNKGYGTDHSARETWQKIISRFLYPWVDSYGKSVTFGFDEWTPSNASENFTVYVSSTCRGNIELNGSVELVGATNIPRLGQDDYIAGGGLSEATYHMPLLGNVTTGGLNPINKQPRPDYTISYVNQVHEITQSPIYSNPTVLGNSYIFSSVDPVADQAGDGLINAYRCFHMSNLRLAYDNGRIYWCTEVGNKTRVREYDSAAISEKNVTNSGGSYGTLNATSYIIEEERSGGFGLDFRLRNGYFITNSYEVIDRGAADFLDVFKKDADGIHNRIAKFSASVGANDPKYNIFHPWLKNTNLKNYDNTSLSTKTWDIDLTGRYEIIDEYVVLRDPLEYSIFGFQNFRVSVSPAYSSASLEPYLALYENFAMDQAGRNKSARATNYSPTHPTTVLQTDQPQWNQAYSSVDGSFRLSQGITYDPVVDASTLYCKDTNGSGPNKEGVLSTSSVPIMYYGLRKDMTNTLISDLTITFDVDDINSQFNFYKHTFTGPWSTWEQRPDGSYATDNVLPRIVLYKRDPRETIIQNGTAGRRDGNPNYIYSHYGNYAGDGPDLVDVWKKEFLGHSYFTEYYNVVTGYSRYYYDASGKLARDYYTQANVPHSIRKYAPRSLKGIWVQQTHFDWDGLYEEIDLYGYDFPGWYRGGAQDLFMYQESRVKKRLGMQYPYESWRTDGSFEYGPIPARGGYPTLAMLHRYTQRGLGNGAGVGAGWPIGWMARDNFPANRGYFVDEPLAKIYSPKVVDGKYTITIPKEDVESFLIQGNLIKNGATRVDQFMGDFDDDVARNITQNLGSIENYTLCIGFVMTNLDSYSLKDGERIKTWQEPIPDRNIGAIKHITNDSGDVRYPYQGHCKFFTQSPFGNKFDGRSLYYNLSATVSNIDVSMDFLDYGLDFYNGFRNVFHKIAVINHSQDSRFEATGGTIFGRESNGSDNHIPVSLQSDRIIAINRKTKVFENLWGESESVNDFEIISSQELGSIENERFDESEQEIFDSYYTSFKQKSVLGSYTLRTGSLEGTRIGGYDLYASRLATIGAAPKNILTRLNSIGAAPSSGISTLHAHGSLPYSAGADLFTGQRVRATGAPMFTFAPIPESMSLFTYEIQPSSNTTAFVRGPDIIADMSLVFTPYSTGAIPLVSYGPIPLSNSMSLARVPTFSGGVPLRMDSIGFASGDMSLNTVARGFEDKDATLAFSPGHSGNMSLYIVKGSGFNEGTDLFMSDAIGVRSGVVPLSFVDTADQKSKLFIKPQRYHNDDADLFVKSQVPSSSIMKLNTSGPSPFDSRDTELVIRSFYESGNISMVTKPFDVASGELNMFLANKRSAGSIDLCITHPEYLISPLFTFRSAFDQINDASLVTRALYSSGQMSIFVDPIAGESTDVSLTTKVSYGDGGGFTAPAPLFVGKEAFNRNNLNLFTSNDKYARSPGTDPSLNFASVFIPATEYTPSSINTTLYIESESQASGVSSVSLLLSGPNTPPVLSGSGLSQLIITGNNNDEIYISKTAKFGLNISSTIHFSGDAALYLERPLEVSTPLYMRSLVDSDDINVYISGNNTEGGNTDLYISPPTSNQSEFFTRGYLE